MLYINPNDYSDDMYLLVKYVLNYDLQNTQVANKNVLYTELQDNSVSDMYNYFATTSSVLKLGTYTLNIELRKSTWYYSTLDFLGLDSFLDYGVVMSTTTQFIASTTSVYDDYVNDVVSGVDNFFASSTINSDACNLTSFSIKDCFSLIFAFQPALLAEPINELKEGFLSYVPFGYITRMAVILASSTPVDIPAIDYTFSTSSNSVLSSTLGGQRIYIAPFDDASTTLASITSDGANGLPQKTFWQIFEPFYTTIIYLGLFLMMIRDLSHISVHGGKKGQGVKSY